MIEQKYLSNEERTLLHDELVKERTTAYNQAVWMLKASDGYDCPLCKNKGFTAVVTYVQQYGAFVDFFTPCSCMAVREKPKAGDLDGRCQMGKNHNRYVRQSENQAFAAASRWKQHRSYLGHVIDTCGALQFRGHDLLDRKHSIQSQNACR